MKGGRDETRKRTWISSEFNIEYGISLVLAGIGCAPSDPALCGGLAVMADHHPAGLLGGACPADHLDPGMGHQWSNTEAGTEECESIFEREGSEGEEIEYKRIRCESSRDERPAVFLCANQTYSESTCHLVFQKNDIYNY